MRPFCPIFVLMLLAIPVAVDAHPVPKDNHDRTIRVRLVPGDKPGEMTVRVDYRLEVDETTVVLDDMRPFQDQVDPAKFRGQPLAYYAEYMRIYGPILARQFIAKIDGRELTFKPVSAKPALKDEDGKDLGHLRCDFVFEAPATYPMNGAFRLDIREGAFLLQEGEVRLSLDRTGPWIVDVRAAPDEALWKRPPTERQPGDEDRLRELRAVFRNPPPSREPPPSPPVVSAPPETPPPSLPLVLGLMLGVCGLMFLAQRFFAAARRQRGRREDE